MPDEGLGSHDDVARSMAQLGGVLLNEQSLHQLLELVVALARSTVSGADGVSVSLVANGAPVTSNSSDEVVQELTGSSTPAIKGRASTP